MPNLQLGEGYFRGSTSLGMDGCPVEFHYAIMEKGSSIGKHFHNEETEYYYMISGEGVYNDNGKAVTLKPGDICVTGGGEFHSIENKNDEPIIFIGIISKHQ